MSWLYLSMISGVLVGFYYIVQKMATQNTKVLNVLFVHCFFCFLFMSVNFNQAKELELYTIFLIFIKAFIIFIGWTCSMNALKNLPISIITPFNTITPLLTIIIGIVFLHEVLSIFQILGIIILLTSYYMISKSGNIEVNGLFRNKYFWFMFVGAVSNALSAVLDKVIMKNAQTPQMQFWFMFFLWVLYTIVLIYNKIKTKEKFYIEKKSLFFILCMSIFILVADYIYFNVVKDPKSMISIILPLRNMSIIVSVLVGGLIFKEKNLLQKFFRVIFVIIGLALMFYS